MGKHAADLTGARYGLLVVQGHEGRDKHGNVIWRCQCDCGGVAILERSRLTGRHPVTHCGCKTAANRSSAMARENKRRAVDLTGLRFGMLVVQGRATSSPRYWRCLCACGREVLRAGAILSKATHCGCQHVRRPKPVAQKLPPPARKAFRPVTVLDRFLYLQKPPVQEVQP